MPENPALPTHCLTGYMLRVGTAKPTDDIGRADVPPLGFEIGDEIALRLHGDGGEGRFLVGHLGTILFHAIL